MTLPVAVTIGACTAGDNQVSQAFTPVTATPVVTNHQYRIGSGKWNDCPNTSPVVIAGLENGKLVSITMRAVNSDGPGPASSAATATPIENVATRNDGWTDASDFANPGLVAPQMDWNDPDD